MKKLGIILLVLLAAAGLGVSAAYYAEEEELPEVIQDKLRETKEALA